MNQASKIETPVEEVTAAALLDARRREAVGRLSIGWSDRASTAR